MTLEDAKKLTTFAKTYGLGGLHFWSINRDVLGGTDVRTRTSALCRGLSAERKLALTVWRVTSLGEQGSPYESKRNAGLSFTTRLHSATKPRIALMLHVGYLAVCLSNVN